MLEERPEEGIGHRRRLGRQKVVIKYGGSTIGALEFKKNFAKSIVSLKKLGANPVVVHGGGPQITKRLQHIGKEARFVDGQRVTDQETMDVVQSVLLEINKEIVALIAKAGGAAVGLVGQAGDLLRARPYPRPDLGLVGEVEAVNTGLLEKLIGDGFIPVIASVGIGKDGESYNINADLAAGEIAAALASERLVFLTDVPGILDDEGQALSTLTCKQVEELVREGVISGGMLPKVKAALVALQGGVSAVNICSGTQLSVLLQKFFSDTGVGTRIVKCGNPPN